MGNAKAKRLKLLIALVYFIYERIYKGIYLLLSPTKKLIQIKTNSFKYKKSCSKIERKSGAETWLSLLFFRKK